MGTIAWRAAAPALAVAGVAGVTVLAMVQAPGIDDRLGIVSYIPVDEPPEPRRRPSARFGLKRAEVWAAYEGREQGFSRMGLPLLGEWLSSFAEPGQTFTEFEKVARRKTEVRRRVYLQPFGGFGRRHAELLGQMQRFGAAFFDSPVVVLAARPMPRRAWHPARQQYDVVPLMDMMAAEVPADALFVVGFTDRDLFHRGLNFVFGTAQPSARAGVYSIHRFGGPDDPKLLERTLAVFAHEAAHLIGLDHCVFWECGMNGANSLQESDSRHLHFCPLDEDKLVWALGADARARRVRIAQFYESVGMGAEAAFALARN